MVRCRCQAWWWRCKVAASEDFWVFYVPHFTSRRNPVIQLKQIHFCFNQQPLKRHTSCVSMTTRIALNTCHGNSFTWKTLSRMAKRFCCSSEVVFQMYLYRGMLKKCFETPFHIYTSANVTWGHMTSWLVSWQLTRTNALHIMRYYTLLEMLETSL